MVGWLFFATEEYSGSIIYVELKCLYTSKSIIKSGNTLTLKSSTAIRVQTHRHCFTSSVLHIFILSSQALDYVSI
ncbi:CLUMA_CG013250, isoform A [Clunio marinus]|uniref:CLUMA_CG013250, isoform A n=1 Tax=Clunio marinus TaxID=568069 RepID=A0A1J1IN98_9DIPT|nr:CLUMA_CG013250, isoform A [Clunio marinus]